ncbi:hypothetical protein AM1H77_08020 [Apilactobacillus micheneri]
MLTTLAETAGNPAKYNKAGYDANEANPVTVPRIPAKIPTGMNNKIIHILIPKIVILIDLLFIK